MTGREKGEEVAAYLRSGDYARATAELDTVLTEHGPWDSWEWEEYEGAPVAGFAATLLWTYALAGVITAKPGDRLGGP